MGDRRPSGARRALAGVSARLAPPLASGARSGTPRENGLGSTGLRKSHVESPGKRPSGDALCEKDASGRGRASARCGRANGSKRDGGKRETERERE